MATVTLAVVAIPIAIRIELSAAWPEREVRRLAFGSLPFGPWQLRANQRTMNRPFVAVGALVHRGLVGLGHGLDGRLRRGQFDVLL
jgi:hypothetical protein